MKTLLSLFLAVTATLHAATIPLELGPPQNFVSGQTLFNIDALNGTPLNGQTLSLDFVFPLSQTSTNFVRLTKRTNQSFEIGLHFDVTPSFWSNHPFATSYTVSQSGIANSIIWGGDFPGVPDATAFGFGIFPLLADDTGRVRNDTLFPFEFYGVHLDMTLPDSPGSTLTGTSLQLLGTNYGIGPWVPESGTAAALLGLGLLALMAYRNLAV